MSTLKIGMITSVNTSKEVKDDKGNVTKKARKYAKLATGDVVFGSTDMDFKQGDYIIFQQTFQTQDGEGNELENPKPVNVMTSVWESKVKAIHALAETQLVDAEVNAYVKAKTKRIEETFDVESYEKLAETA